ncbi:TetR family transcriptional regulator C-terminal domain-containing protein [Streptomyces anulatus]
MGQAPRGNGPESLGLPGPRRKDAPGGGREAAATRRSGLIRRRPALRQQVRINDQRTSTSAVTVLARGTTCTSPTTVKECGEVPDDTDQDLAALELHSLVEGLAPQLGCEPDAATSRAALALVTTRVQAVFPGRCRPYE